MQRDEGREERGRDLFELVELLSGVLGLALLTPAASADLPSLAPSEAPRHSDVCVSAVVC